MLGLLVEGLQRVGVGRVSGLGLLGLGHVQLVEQHRLQLLGRAEVDLLADHLVGGLRGRPDALGERFLELPEVLDVDRDARGLEVGEHEQQGQLHLGEQRLGVDAVQLGVEGVGEFGDSSRFEHRLLGDLARPAIVVEERELTGVGAIVGSQFAS
ncbi:Uncharacterised protein [Mycobacteroides abscessus subsp. abscessus]|nr:Uncharacterised protein [Mycobacteroides abscessus subsp. abscessus]